MVVAMMRHLVLLGMSVAVLASCGGMDRLKPNVRAPVLQSGGPVDATRIQSLPGAQTAAALDTTTEAERAAAMDAPVAGARELGKITVALGSPAEQGFWMSTALVSAPVKGKVMTAGGMSVAVDLRPGTGGALLSLAAYRALGLSLTDLPEVAVFAE